MNNIDKQKERASNTEELLDHLIEIIENNDSRFSLEWSVGGETITMEIYDKLKDMGDIILSTAAQQYGGFTVPEADKILEPYAEKSYRKYFDEFKDISFCVDSEFDNDLLNDIFHHSQLEISQNKNMKYQNLILNSINRL